MEDYCARSSTQCGIENVLAIDLGTTTVKVVVLQGCRQDENCAKRPKIVFEASKDILENDFKRYEERDEGSGLDGRSEQSIPAVLTTLGSVLKRIPAKIQMAISSIGVSCQMHGCAFWKQEDESFKNSLFVNWQDKRCSSAFIEETFCMLTPDSNVPQSGYGWATVMHFLLKEPKGACAFNRICTIGDLLVHKLVGNPTNDIATCHANAQSWGAYNLIERVWDKQFLEAFEGLTSQISEELQDSLKMVPPRIVEPGTCLGRLKKDSLFVSTFFGDVFEHVAIDQVSVFVCLDDLSASLFGKSGESKDDANCIVNIGTSLQISYILPPIIPLKSMLNSIQNVPSSDISGPLEVRPFLDRGYVLVWASLNGGNCLHLLLKSWIDMYEQVQCALVDSATNDCSVLRHSEETSFSRLYAWCDQLMLNRLSTDLVCDPCWNGERGNTSQVGLFSNIHVISDCGSSRLNFSMEDQCLSLIFGMCCKVVKLLDVFDNIVQNTGRPNETLPIRHILLCGGLPARMKSFKPLFVKTLERYARGAGACISNEDAAYGCALYTLDVLFKS
eukprot:Nk52_evm38s2309 gene=Nk52_evmTU38s2309